MLKEAPFNPRTGDMYGYVGGYERDIEWRPNEPFDSTLTLEDFSRGRSSVKFLFKDQTGARYEMFAKDAIALFKDATVVDGKVTNVTKWQIVKRGANYGIQAVR